jgi:hypothetical protein
MPRWSRSDTSVPNSDSVVREVYVHPADEHAIDLGQDQRSGAKKALDLGGIGASARSLPHARFRIVIDLVDQVRESFGDPTRSETWSSSSDRYAKHGDKGTARPSNRGKRP